MQREISLKVMCEKVKCSNCDFSDNFHDFEWKYIYIIQNQFKGDGNIESMCISNASPY